MKLRTGLLVLSVAAVATWVMPSLQKDGQRTAHEFLMVPAQSMAAVHTAPGVEPIQLALLFQTTVR